MNLICDACYFEARAGQPAARMAGLLFSDWDQAAADQEWTQEHAQVEPYESGSFFKREMPLLLALIESLPVAPTCVVVDGFAWLGGAQGVPVTPGLGARLWEALDRTIPVIGLAKNRFAGAPKEQELLRGSSQKPLFVSAAGLSQEEATQRVLAMHGRHRLPTLATRVDRLCRDGIRHGSQPTQRATNVFLVPMKTGKARGPSR